MAKPKVGCQLIVYRRREEEHLDDVLREVRANGYDGVESRILAGGNAAEVKRALDANGLVQWSVGTPFAQLDQIGRSIDYITAVGGKFIMVSGVGNYQEEGLAAYETAAERFNQVGQQCKEAGIQFCYHNHSWEFAEYDRQTRQEVATGTPGAVTGLERLYELTDPTLVKGAVDVYWVQHGGRNPAEFLTRHLDRVAYPHFKDMRYVGRAPRRQGRLLREEGEFVELGRGEVDLKAIWKVLEPLNLPWVVYEQDRSTIEPGEAARISRAYLRDALGI